MEPLSLETLRRLDAGPSSASVHRPRRSAPRRARTSSRSASGCYVIDEHGRALLDGLAGLWCVNVGYGRARDRRRGVPADDARSPSTRRSSTPRPSRPSCSPASSPQLAPARLQHSLLQQLGLGGERDGAEADPRLPEAARHAARRRRSSRRTFAYHGVTLATTSMTGLPSCTEPFDLPLPGFVQVPGPHPYGANSGMTPAQYGELVPRRDRAHHRCARRRRPSRRCSPSRSRAPAA